MKPDLAQKLLKQVKETYHAIADEFSKSRSAAWDEFSLFKPYLKPGMVVADIGCGNGRLVELFEEMPEIEYIGIDNSEPLLDIARQRHPQKKFLAGDMLKLPLGHDSLDAIFCIASLHHIPSYRLRMEALHEMYRVVKHGGYLFLTVWNLWQKKYRAYVFNAFSKWIRRKYEYGPTDVFIPFGEQKLPRYYHAFIPLELKFIAKKAGFKILKLVKTNFNFVLICRKKG